MSIKFNRLDVVAVYGLTIGLQQLKQKTRWIASVENGTPDRTGLISVRIQVPVLGGITVWAHPKQCRLIKKDVFKIEKLSGEQAKMLSMLAKGPRAKLEILDDPHLDDFRMNMLREMLELREQLNDGFNEREWVTICSAKQQVERLIASLTK